ncbi:hypothetical protein GQ53DRAFT_747315 [Thozetella sp. PMI_491]|nr:hypothetical protein GQ53DRAFT_747315 [Thozetella sp. PMI_491]
MAAPDETMADFHSSDPSKSATAAGDGSAQSAGQGSKGAANWNTKKWQEEYEAAKSRLSDQKFSSTEYPDPLAPRRGVHPKAYPSGTTVELGMKLKGFVEKVRAKDA